MPLARSHATRRPREPRCRDLARDSDCRSSRARSDVGAPHDSPPPPPPPTTTTTALLSPPLKSTTAPSVVARVDHRLPFTPEGTAIFRACLNNKNSRFVRKVVQFDLRHVDDTPMNEKDPLKKKGEKKFGKGKKGKGGAEADEAKEDAMDGHGKKEDLDKVQNSINNLRKLSQDVSRRRRRRHRRPPAHAPSTIRTSAHHPPSAPARPTASPPPLPRSSASRRDPTCAAPCSQGRAVVPPALAGGGGGRSASPTRRAACKAALVVS